MAYTQYGSFTNGSSPGINATFLNNLETFLLSLNSLSYDSLVTASSGNITAVGTIQFTSGNEKIFSHTGSAILDASGNTDLKLNAPNTGGSHKIYLQVGGVNVFSVDSSGVGRLLSTLSQSTTP
jgi:hypothetical protein